MDIKHGVTLLLSTLMINACIESRDKPSSDSASGDINYQPDTNANTNPNLYGLKLNAANIKRTLDGKEYTVTTSGLPLNDSIEKIP